VKNQYAADVNDYCKYGLLRALTASGGITSTVAWMLTADDASRDGGKLSYLSAPKAWRLRDPQLFDALAAIVATGQPRSVAAIAAAGIIPGARYHADHVPRPAVARRAHFEQTLALAAGSELLFFDPDNGLEVASCPLGRSGSEKYLLWSELTDAYQAGHSVLIYQHFPRLERETYVNTMAAQIAERTGACEVFTFRTAGVVFFLAPQHGATEYYADRAEALSQAWRGVIASSLVAVA
jgi:hypothetical protein